MRFLLLALMAAFLASTSFVGAPPSVVVAQGADLLPTESELNATLAPFTVSNFMVGPGKDGWDATADFDINGSPEGLLHSSVDASELATKESAAGFLQTKLQQLRDGTAQGGFLGDLGPAADDLTFEADEAYWGVYLAPPSAPSPMVVAIHLSRFETQVISTTVIMRPNGNGPISDNAAQTLGVMTGLLVHLMNAE